jgi:hypothetical protein
MLLSDLPRELEALIKSFLPSLFRMFMSRATSRSTTCRLQTGRTLMMLRRMVITNHIVRCWVHRVAPVLTKTCRFLPLLDWERYAGDVAVDPPGKMWS